MNGTETDSYLSPFTNNGQWNHPGSTNAGTWTGSTGQPLPGQGAGESAASFATRSEAHHYAANTSK